MIAPSLAPRLVAHRGYCGRYPENTLLSISEAIKAGARHIEFDVQMNADRQLLALHDTDFLRTSGQQQSVFDTTDSALAGISVHHPDRFGEHFRPEPPPLLKQVLELCEAHPRLQLFVEIKEESLDHWGIVAVMQEVNRQLSHYPNPSVIITYSARAISYVREISELPCGWVIKKYDRPFLSQAARLKPQYLICNQRKVPRTGLLADGSWQWMLYGITQPEQLRRFDRQGVALFETDYIGEMLKALETTSLSISP